ncbi:MAG: glycosyltransferase family 4 protein [Acetobacteraceae bacterium]
MRILYSHRIQSRDGQSVHVEELVQAFRAAGHEVRVVAPGFYDQSSFGGESPVVALLRRWLPGMAGELAEIAYNVPTYLRLRREWKAFRPDFVYERYNLYFLAGALLARWNGAALFLEVNSPLAEERSRFGGLKLRRLALALERFTWKSARRVLPVTQVLGEMMVARGVSPQRMSVVPNGIVLSRFPPRTERRVNDDVTLGFVGFVRDWHRLDTVIDALAQAHDGQRLRLTVVGDGPVRLDLEQQAAALGVQDRVHFTGLVPHQEVADHVRSFDIALQPAVTPYASPLKIFDYMAAGCAIVAPDQPNIREILRHEDTALLFDPANHATQWDAIQRLARDTPLRQALGRAARAELERRNYTWSGNAERITAWAARDAGVTE